MRAWNLKKPLGENLLVYVVFLSKDQKQIE